MSWAELADYIGAGLALLLGVGVGRRMRPKPPEPLKPICSCNDGYGQHLDGGKCHGEIRRIRYSASGSQTGYTYVQCPCLRYDGPNPAIFNL